jgi:hypothetical protein
MIKKGPYVGITGFMSAAEVNACDNTFREAFFKLGGTVATHNMKFMIGVLVSSKTLAGGTNKWFNRYPVMSQLPDIISSNQGHHLRTIHYNTDDVQTIDEQIDQLMAISPNIDAIQLNIKWVNHVKLQRIGRKYPDLRIILQIGSGALAEVDEIEDIFLGKALWAYEGVAHDFLIDPSGGEGKLVDVCKALMYISDNEIPKSMQPGAAGGLNADNVHILTSLIRRMRRPINLDTEKRVRTEDEGGGHLIVTEAQRYLGASVPLLGAGMTMAYQESSTV